MPNTELLKTLRKLNDPFHVEPGSKFKLKQIDTAETAGIESKEHAEGLLKQGVELLQGLQERLYAQSQWSVLCIFQAMDAAGKDGAIKHVMSGVNPQGCEVHSFKAPSANELDHDFLWRSHLRMPARGRIGIFNRSYYEETLVVRVHEELLRGQRIPEAALGKNVWEDRFEDINAFERYLFRNGIVIRKFYLHLSKEEQKKRFLQRLDRPEKNWKFSAADIKERGHWDEYMEAYQETIRSTSTTHAPWYVVPADKKWFTRVVVASVIIEAMEELDLAFPELSTESRESLAGARQQLMDEE